MLKATFSSFWIAKKYLIQDRVILFLSLIPIFIGLVLYLLGGQFLYSTFLEIGQKWITEYISAGAVGSFIYYILFGLLSLVLIFITNWTFVLVVSILAGPFNDIISSRVERLMEGKKPESLKDSFSRMIKKIAFILINELKKISLILTLTLFALLISLFPILAPLGFIISAILLASTFLDYNWSRHDQHIRECIRDIRGHFIAYLIGGAIFTFLFTIPVLNLLIYPYAVIYFSVLWNKSRMS
jgi:CysZ protein